MAYNLILHKMIYIYAHIYIYGLVKEKTYFDNILAIAFYIYKVCLLQLFKSVAETVKPQNWSSRLQECAYTSAFLHRILFIIEMFRLLAVIWNGHIMIENERMKQFSRMRELDKVYRGLFRTLSEIRCDENVFAEIVND